MVRWRLCLVLALLLLPGGFEAKSQDDDEDEDRVDETEEEEDDEDEEEEEEPTLMEKSEHAVNGRRAQSAIPPTLTVKPGMGIGLGMTKTPRRRPLECYACAYNGKTSLKSCLDPTKFRQDRVHTITCTDVNDKCYTTVVTGKDDMLEGVVRGCRPNCMVTPDTTCCDSNRCNSHAYTQPVIQPRVVKAPLSETNSKSSSIMPPNIFFFVTILLVLQTVVKVSLV